MKPKFQYVVPVLKVSDLGSATAFFEAIGFDCHWVWGDPPAYAGLYDGSDHVLHLQQQATVAPEATGLYLQVADVDAAYAVCEAAGLDILNAPADQAYGMRDFVVNGPDGIRITFGQEQEA